MMQQLQASDDDPQKARARPKFNNPFVYHILYNPFTVQNPTQTVVYKFKQYLAWMWDQVLREDLAGEPSSQSRCPVFNSCTRFQ